MDASDTGQRMHADGEAVHRTMSEPRHGVRQRVLKVPHAKDLAAASPSLTSSILRAPLFVGQEPPTTGGERGSRWVYLSRRPAIKKMTWFEYVVRADFPTAVDCSGRVGGEVCGIQWGRVYVK